MIECPSCGNNLVYDISRKNMYCKACENTYTPESVEKEQDGVDSSQMELSLFICPQCGGGIYSTDDAATAFCSFCGAATMLTSRLKSERKPDYVMPFTITKERCKDEYSQMMKRAIYAPRKLRSKRNIQEFRGIYIPYWLYNVQQTGKATVYAKDYYNTSDARVEETYEVVSYVSNHFEELAVDASSLFPDDLSSMVAPFYATGMKPFVTGYLSGFYADLPDVDYDVYKDRMARITGDLTYNHFVQQITEKNDRMEIQEPLKPMSEMLHMDITDTKTGLFPVWFMSYKNGKRIAYAAVNGRTGKVATDIPMDVTRFLMGCLIGTIPICVLLNLLVTIRPSVLLAIAAVIGAFVTLIHCKEMEKISKVENRELDVGYFARHTLNARLEKERKRQERATTLRDQYGDAGVDFEVDQPVVISKSSKKKANAAGSGMKLSYRLLFGMLIVLAVLFGLERFGILAGDFVGMACYGVAPIACLVAIYGASLGIKNVKNVKKKSGTGGIFTVLGCMLAVAIIILHPVKDLYYYGGVVIVCVAVILTLIDVVLSHNRLSTRPLPQFEYEGGDHRA